ncbi:hypothetical protein [Enterobacter cancerogenus]|nr:hypothetical protein [Enterobacter cancerogenus]
MSQTQISANLGQANISLDAQTVRLNSRSRKLLNYPINFITQN